jgi:hypothetical protein
MTGVSRWPVFTLFLCPALAAGGPPTGKASPKQASARDAGPLVRKVEGQVLASPEMPAVRIRFADGFKYAGGQTFILYRVARAEQHFFVDADDQGRLKRLYWIQFEGFLPDNKQRYRYPPTQVVKLGGLDFVADSAARNIKTSSGGPNSDGARARAFLEKKGYRFMSNDVLSQRLVHLVDDEKRNELMIIYMEDLSGMKLTAKDFSPGGRAAGRWRETAKGLLERAVKGMEFSR